MSKSYDSCCVSGCTNSYNTTANVVPKIRFHKFPFRPWEADRRVKWINFVNQHLGLGEKQWQPTNRSYICSVHFVGNKKVEDPRSPGYIPSVSPPRRIRQPNRFLDSQVQEKSGKANTENTKTAATKNVTASKNTKVSKKPPKKKEKSTKDLQTNSEENKDLRCFVCYSSEDVKSFNHQYLEIPTRVPDKVLTQLEKKLPNNVIESLKNPSPFYYPCFCKVCLEMSNEIVKHHCRMESIMAEISKAVDIYANHIIIRRGIMEEAKPMIRFSKSCFESDNEDYGDNTFNCNDSYDEMEVEDPEMKYSIPDVDLDVSNCLELKLTESRPRKQKFVPNILKQQSNKSSKATVEDKDENIKTSHHLKNLQVSLKRISHQGFHCGICGKSFASKRLLKGHTPTHIRMVSPKCPTCKHILTEKINAKVTIQRGQCLMHCANCKKEFVFAKEISNSNVKSFVGSASVNIIRNETKPANDPPKTVEVKEFFPKKCKKKDKPELKSCKICGLPVLLSMLNFHMGHYHPDAPIESDSEIELVAIKIKRKLVTKKPPIQEDLPKTPPQKTECQKAEKTKLKCMTCNNELSSAVPILIANQMKAAVEKFPNRKLLYCGQCKKAFVVGGKAETLVKSIANAKKPIERFKFSAEHNKFKCLDCDGVFATQYSACYHGSFDCKNITRTCDAAQCKHKLFNSAFKLKNHVESEHSKMDKSLWNICNKCGDSYGDRTTHQTVCTQTHEKTCNQCGVVLLSSELLFLHIRKNHPVPPRRSYPVRQKRLCENCGKTFGSLKEHIPICGKYGKALQCKHCKINGGDSLPQLFETKRKLKMHVTLYHVLTHKCPICGKGFSRWGNVKQHIKFKHDADSFKQP